MWIIYLVQFLTLLVGVLIGVAVFTVVERKSLSGMQKRSGPNQIGLFGILQAIADGLKLILKSFTLPEGSDKWLFLIGPLLSFGVGLGVWACLPLCGSILVDSKVTLILVLALSSVGIHGVLLGGYASNNKYSYYGGVRSGAQMISYEVSLAFVLGGVVLLDGGSFSLGNFASLSGMWLGLGGWPFLLIWLISILAETNRHPFDLPEAESELVSGYNVEYSGGSFALYFLGEGSSILFMCVLTGYLFFGGYAVSWLVLLLFFIWTRGAWPRVRYDQLMTLGWGSLLPLGIAFLLGVMGLVV